MTNGPTPHLEHLEQVAIHVKDLEVSMSVYEELGVKFLPIMRVEGPPGTFRTAGSNIGISLVEVEPEGLRAVGFKVQDLAGIKAKLAQHGIEPVLEFDADGYDEAQFVIDNVRFSFAEYDPIAPGRMTAAILSRIVEV